VVLNDEKAVWIERAALFLAGVIVGGLLLGCSPANAMEAKDFDAYKVIRGHGVIIVLQNGSFNCKDAEHRSIMANNQNGFMLGCGTFDGGHKFHILWETGTTFDIETDKTDGPAPEKNWTPEKGYPERNASREVF